MGTVKEISVFTTELASLDNLQLIVPNGQIWGSSITNFSTYSKRRLDLKFNVAYENEIKFVEDLISDVLDSDPRVDSVPDKLVRVDSIDSNSMGVLVRVWCNAGDYFTLKLDLIKTVKTELDKNGVNSK